MPASTVTPLIRRMPWSAERHAHPHHGEHAGEEPGPGCALEHLPHRPRVDGDQRLLRVHLGGTGREHQRHLLFRAYHQVVVQGARVAVKVLARPELERVDEHGHHDGSVRHGKLERAPEQRNVTGVERAHGRDQHHR